MNRIVTSQTGVGNGAIIPLNYNNVQVGIALACVLTGTANYTIYHTYDDIFNPAVTPTWWAHGIPNLVGATTSQEGNFVLPVSACRITINSGTGTLTLTILEQGII